jgi:DNA repair protein SbcC/Rad50
VIPLHLKLSGFLSYHDPVELDFSSFDLACISGQNGAGKSSLLDAMTWALFGQARKRDEALINQQSKTAQVIFTFTYENNIYRVLRSLSQGKATTLEFQIAEKGDQQRWTENQKWNWHPLTEHSNRETQVRIEQVLRLDYETFINVSFFLQGHADQFAQQTPTRRKEILGNILGLEVWEAYKEHTAEHRKLAEGELGAIDGRMAEIEAELAEEEPRKTHLAELESQLSGLVASRKIQETALSSARQVHAGLDKQRELVLKMAQALERTRGNLSGYQARLAEKEAQRRPHADLLGRSNEIEADFHAWQEARLELEKWDGIASKFHEQEKLRFPFLDEINTEKVKLEQERHNLEEQAEVVSSQSSMVVELGVQKDEASRALSEAEEQISRQVEVEAERKVASEKRDQLSGENKSLFDNMQELNDRIKKLEKAEGVVCPLCGQSLSPEHRRSTLEQLNIEGKQKGDTWRANKATIEELTAQIAKLDNLLILLFPFEEKRLALSNNVAQLTERIHLVHKLSEEWGQTGAVRLKQVEQTLGKDQFAAKARKKLAELDRELASLRYQGAVHDMARRDEFQKRPVEVTFRTLEAARAALKPLDDEIANLRSEIANRQMEIENQQSEFDEAAVTLAAGESAAPDLDSAEQLLFDSQDRENELTQEVGAARQKVTVLDELRKRKRKLTAERGDLGLQISRYKTLERAFGKDGVPALLIEQALPEIEMKSNEILGRLSDDTMRLHFETQAKYKDEKRKDLRETLEIQVSDGAGQRDYEMFSGGEAFRVNFAIRLALSEVLAQRKGARLQMLVIDEGFGSQDTQGRQRLIQAINAVRPDFAKILVITHLEELKDAFPIRIEVEKTETGSTVTVI